MTTTHLKHSQKLLKELLRINYHEIDLQSNPSAHKNQQFNVFSSKYWVIICSLSSDCENSLTFAHSAYFENYEANLDFE